MKTGDIYEQRHPRVETFEVRKVLDASTRFVVFLENMFCTDGYEIPEVPAYVVTIIRSHRVSGGAPFVKDRELDNDWVLRSVTKNTFNRWIHPKTTVCINA